MKLRIEAIGRLKVGPEKDLCSRYFERASGLGRKLGISSVDVHDLVESRQSNAEQRKMQEAESLLSRIDQSAFVVVLDEHGKMPTSQMFSQIIDDVRQDGRDIVFCIGGADGHGQALLDRADAVIAFGRLTWPHQLVRILLAEQIYRALTLISGHPYHRS